LRPSITVPTQLARRYDVIDAALAVNDAPTLEEAFRLLTEAARDLVGARSVTVVVSPGEAGDASVVRVPLATAQPSSLEAAWDAPLSEADVGEARDLLFTLTRLTNVGERSLRERERRLLVETGKLAAVGELAAGVAHEINNPLFAILGLTEFLLTEAEPGSKSRERLELIQETGLEIKEIVRALLDFAREDPGKRRTVPLEDVVESAVDLVRRTNANKGVELVASYEAGGALVDASPSLLKQIFLHLMTAALRAVPDGGVIAIAVRRDASWLDASVSHDGAAALDPSPGLAVSRGLAEEQGGRLTASGSTWTLRLPAGQNGERP
jgi:signal transduction histidine kinase